MSLQAFFFFFASIFLVLTSAWLQNDLQNETPRPPGSPWPYPKEMRTQHDMMTLDPSEFKLTTNAKGCDIVTSAIERYKDLIFVIGDRGTTDPGIRVLKGINIHVDRYGRGSCGYPALEDDESYELKVEYRDQTAHLSASTVWGALRGLETFSQLVFLDEKTKTYRINVTTIDDAPRFAHRGVLLDTSRHFLPVNVIKQNMDAMAYNKMNVFHWHIVDDESFPFESRMYPNLTTIGAYQSELVYSQEMVKDVIEYGRLRGVRVVPEFDSPAHNGAMAKAFPHLMTSCTGTKNEKQGSSSGETLNPTLTNTYSVLKEIIHEFGKVFADQYIHLGMRDINNDCWKNNMEFELFKRSQKIKGSNGLEEYYTRNVIKVAQQLNLKSMIWQDAVEGHAKISGSPVVQIWKDTSLNPKMLPWTLYVKQMAKSDYKIVISSCWNLDYISYGEDWKRYYECDPQSFVNPDEAKLKRQVIGGEAIMWGEYVDSTNLISRLWPRTSAVAERLWSGVNKNNVHEARPRLKEHRCRMIRRGIPAEPISSGYCGSQDRNTNSLVFVYQTNFTHNCSSECEDQFVYNCTEAKCATDKPCECTVVACKDSKQDNCDCGASDCKDESDNSTVAPCEPTEPCNCSATACKEGETSTIAPCEPMEQCNCSATPCNEGYTEITTIVPCKPTEPCNCSATACNEGKTDVSTVAPCEAKVPCNCPVIACNETKSSNCTEHECKSSGHDLQSATALALFCVLFVQYLSLRKP